MFPEFGLGLGYAWTMTQQTVRDAVLDFAEELPAVENGVPNFVPCSSMSSGDSNDRSSRPAATVFARDQPSLSFTFGPQAQQLSCMALHHQMVVVAHLATFTPCTSAQDPACPRDNRYQYSSLVAYGPAGDLLAVYHKSHLFGESNAFDQPAVPDPTFFDAPSVGVRFGMIICYDLQFHEPLDTYVKWGITDVLFSAQYVNGPPTTMAIQQQLGRAALNQVNLIAANAGWGPSVRSRLRFHWAYRC